MSPSDPRERIEALTAVLGALAHPARRQILMTIHFWGGSMSSGQIDKRFGHAWPTTTRHLRVLEDAGLVVSERSGRSRIYHIVRDRLEIVRGWLSWFDQEP